MASESDQEEMENSEADLDHSDRTLGDVKGSEAPVEMSWPRTQQAQARAIYKNLTSEIGLSAQIISDTVVIMPKEAQPKKALQLKADRPLNNRASFRSRASWGDTTLKVVGPEV